MANFLVRLTRQWGGAAVIGDDLADSAPRLAPRLPSRYERMDGEEISPLVEEDITPTAEATDHYRHGIADGTFTLAVPAFAPPAAPRSLPSAAPTLSSLLPVAPRPSPGPIPRSLPDDYYAIAATET